MKCFAVCSVVLESVKRSAEISNILPAHRNCSHSRIYQVGVAPLKPLFCSFAFSGVCFYVHFFRAHVSCFHWSERAFLRYQKQPLGCGSYVYIRLVPLRPSSSTTAGILTRKKPLSPAYSLVKARLVDATVAAIVDMRAPSAVAFCFGKTRHLRQAV